MSEAFVETNEELQKVMLQCQQVATGIARELERRKLEASGILEADAAGVAAERCSAGELAGRETALAQAGGVQQMPELLNEDTQYSPGNSEASVQQFDHLMNTQDEIEFAIPQPDSPTTVLRAVQQQTFSKLSAADEVDERGLSLPPRTPLGRRGRPAVLTPEMTDKLYRLLSVGFSRRQAAAYLGISPGTICRLASQDEEFALELRRAEELTTLQSEMTLMAAARKNWRAAAWYLTFKAKNPAPLSEEEKEEQHQMRLRDERRQSELSRQELLSLGANFDALQNASRQAAESKTRKMLRATTKRAKSQQQ